ncbi:hypothetical protein [Maridesulfovibrio ferrireducens]|uniref:hypothetical protein n=1 Tax=Maridesulfovibrio ferrireducens TaxID=246191 RepID=UPI001A1DD08E|nr:hypothetical protein [Maridesulfovibrio ferrireducens]MBI9110291.1 hypothetical protein [Maridesulfovibrio ferrireducens]
MDQNNLHERSTASNQKEILYRTVENNMRACHDLFSALSEVVDQEKNPAMVLLIEGLCENVEDKINIALSTLHKGLFHENNINPAKDFSGDPVQIIYSAVASMDILVETYRRTNREGDANLIDLLCRQVRTAAENIDNSQTRETEQ